MNMPAAFMIEHTIATHRSDTVHCCRHKNHAISRRHVQGVGVAQVADDDGFIKIT